MEQAQVPRPLMARVRQAIADRRSVRTSSTRPGDARLATDAEEAWLQAQDRLTQAQEEWLRKESEALTSVTEPPSPRGTTSLDELIKEAEVFDREYELVCWRKAQEERYAREEAERISKLEEQEEREVLERINVENAGQYQMMKDLQEASMFLLHEELAEKASYQQLVSMRYSAQQLINLIDETLYMAIQNERNAAQCQVTAAMQLKKESEEAATAERLQLESELAQLKENEEDLLELLEQEKDRTICRICFTRPKNVLTLPCSKELVFLKHSSFKSKSVPRATPAIQQYLSKLQKPDQRPTQMQSQHWLKPV